MPLTDWNILCVDDDEGLAADVHAYIDGEPDGTESGVFRVRTISRFDDALGELETRRYDAVILDVRHGDPGRPSDGQEAGRQVLSEIRSRRFLPVVFYTGV